MDEDEQQLNEFKDISRWANRDIISADEAFMLRVVSAFDCYFKEKGIKVEKIFDTYCSLFKIKEKVEARKKETPQKEKCWKCLGVGKMWSFQSLNNIICPICEGKKEIMSNEHWD